MTKKRRMTTPVLQVLALVLLLPLTVSSYAQIERYVAGTHYTELSVPVNTNDSSKIEVIEAFWYGCVHCFSFEPLINDWASKLPEDVDFKLFPAMWNDWMKIHGQIYYAAEALDAVDLLHEHVFNAINVERNRLQNEEQIGALFVEHGISEEDFERAFNSFSVRTKVNQAEKRMQDYQIRSTPNMVVNGKYVIATGAAVTTQQEMLEVVNFLVEKERQAMRSSGD